MPEPVIDADFTRFPGWDALSPALQREFRAAHLPASFLDSGRIVHFVAGPELAEEDVPALGGRLIRFGRRVAEYSVEHYYVDPATGQVFLADRDGWSIFVNSGLAALASSLRLIEGLREAILHGDSARCSAAGSAILRGVSAIDEPAAESDSLWGSFTTDLEAGAYSDNPDF